MNNELPEYTERLDALHRALEDDFRQIVHRVPLAGAETVVDAGCGDGFFTGLLAERLVSGCAIGLDNSAAYLHVAGKRLSNHIAKGRAQLVEGDVNGLPMDSGSADIVWSAHSMQSYPAIPRALLEFHRVLRANGVLAVLETDNIHSIMLSLPPDLELAIRQAEHREIGDADSYIGTYFPRFARRLLHQAGFREVRREYVFIERQQPEEALSQYIRLYLEHLFDQCGGRLSESGQSRLRALADPAGEEFLPRRENFFFGSLQTLITARAG